MIFNIDLVKAQDAQRAMINIISRHPRCFGGIVALIDTGSPRTIISARDAFLLKIPCEGLEISKPARGFGKGGVPCRVLNNFKFYIKSSDNKIEYITMKVNVVDISALSKMSEEMKDNAFKIPTIIGMDFIVNNKMKLVIDFECNSYFERVDNKKEGT